MKDITVNANSEVIEHALIGANYESGFAGLEIEMKNGVQHETYKVNDRVVTSKPAGQLGESDIKAVIAAFATVDGWLYQRVLRERTTRTYTVYDEGFTGARILYDFCYEDPDVDGDLETYGEPFIIEMEAANRTDYYGGDNIA